MRIENTCRRGHPREGNAVRIAQSPPRKDRHRWQCRACQREWRREYKVSGPYEMDPVKADRIAEGEYSGYIHKTERREAIRLMIARYPDMTTAEMARRAECDPTTVRRAMRSLTKEKTR